jgi:hypothetical protein
VFRSTVVLTVWRLIGAVADNAARAAPFFLTVEKTAADLICVAFVDRPDAGDGALRDAPSRMVPLTP